MLWITQILLVSLFIFVATSEKDDEISIDRCGYSPVPIIEGNVLTEDDYKKGTFLVVGGQTARRGSWPWMVTLEVYRKFFCGGSIITNEWILTAGHCVLTVIGALKQVTLTMGGHVRSEVAFEKITMSLKDAYIHPEFNATTLVNDIALIKLEKPLRFDNSKPISPICLPEEGEELQPGTMTYVLGWGYINAPSGPTSDILKQAMVPVIKYELCKKIYDENKVKQPLRPAKNSFCTHYEKGGHNSCMGDSGSPLVVKKDNHWVQYGVVSWGMKYCAEENSPSVFTKVSAYMPWIRSIMKDHQTSTT